MTGEAAGGQQRDFKKRQRQASVESVFGFATPLDKCRQLQAAWDADHPSDPLNWDALTNAILADLNAVLPEPFTIEDASSRYVTGPDLPYLPPGWTSAARRVFSSLDLQVETYTEENVRDYRAPGQGGYPWPPLLRCQLQ